MIGYPAGSESSDDVEVSSGGELVPLLTLTFSKSGSLGDEGSKNMDGRHARLEPGCRCSRKGETRARCLRNLSMLLEFLGGGRRDPEGYTLTNDQSPLQGSSRTAPKLKL